MTKKHLEIFYHEYADPGKLDSEDIALLTNAHNGLKSSYAPYSRFQVACVLLLEDGTTLLGTNQENAAYGLCLCAEQNALANAGANYPDQIIRSMAITARSLTEETLSPISPCGACRQVINEYEQRQGFPIRLILQGEKGPVLVFESVQSLLPFAFSRDDLPGQDSQG